MKDQYYRNGLINEDHEVFEALFNEYFRKLCTYAMRFLKHEEDAIDTVQRCLVKLWEKRLEVDKINSFQAYLYRSVYNRCLDLLKNEECQRKYICHEEYFLRQTYAQKHECSYVEDWIDKVHLELEKLPQRNKDIFILRYIDGYNTREVSDMLGVSIRSVESYISRSLKILRNKFDVPNAISSSLVLLLCCTLFVSLQNI